MSHPLEGVREKLRRATDHLNALNQETHDWLQTNPYEVWRKRYDNPPRFVFYAERVERSPLQIGVIAGDLFHELRSALDHVVWQLVVQREGTPGEHLQFPIYVGDPGHFYKHTRDSLREVPILARQHIKRMQPYLRRDKDKIARHPLAIVRAISNEDKHRVVLEMVSGLELKGTQLAFPRNDDVGTVHEILLHWGGFLKPGRRIATVRFDPVGPDPQMEMNGRMEMDVAIGEANVRVRTLPGLLGEVWRLIASLRPFFPDEGWPLEANKPVPPPQSLAGCPPSRGHA